MECKKKEMEDKKKEIEDRQKLMQDRQRKMYNRDNSDTATTSPTPPKESMMASSCMAMERGRRRPWKMRSHK